MALSRRIIVFQLLLVADGIGGIAAGNVEAFKRILFFEWSSSS